MDITRKISVVIALYNGAEFLERTVNSVLKQTYPNYEILIVDDNSTDDSLKIAQRMASQFSQISVFHNEENMGFCKSANRGIWQATGELLLVLGQDDVIGESHFEKTVEYFDDKACVGCYCDHRLIDENDNFISETVENSKEILHTRDFRFSNAVSSCGLILRTDVVKEAGGYPFFKDTPQYGEWYLWIKMLEMGNFVKAKETISFYRRHSSNLTNTFSDPSKKAKLEGYWNRCRILAIKSQQLSNLEKVQGVFCYLKHNLKITVLSFLGK